MKMAIENFINQTDFFGVIMNGLTVNITGDLELTLFVVFILITLFALSFGIPGEYIIPIMLPFVIVLMAFGGGLSIIGGVLIFIMVIMLLRMWFI